MRHKAKDVGRNHRIDGEIGRTLAEKHLDRFFPDDMWLKDAATFFLGFLASHHADAQNHRLLDDHHQDRRNQEGGETALRVEHRDIFVLDGIGKGGGLFFGGSH